MNAQKRKIKSRDRRQKHVRRNISGSPVRPRLAIFRSHRHMYCQVIDDTTGRTLASASTRDRKMKSSVLYGGNVKTAETLGAAIAERAKTAGVEQVVFDRRSYKFHGRVKALAESARKGGLKF